MTFRTILDRTNRPDEKMYLLARSNLLDSNNKVIKNELGFAKEGLEDVMEIREENSYIYLSTQIIDGSSNYTNLRNWKLIIEKIN